MLDVIEITLQEVIDTIEEVRTWVESHRSLTDLCTLNTDQESDPDQADETESPSIPFACA